MTTSEPPPLHRISFRFSAAGRYATCLTTAPGGGFVAEHRSFDSGREQRVTLPWPETTHTQPLPCDDGRLLLARTGTGRHELLLTDPADLARTESLTVESRGLQLVAVGGTQGPAVVVQTGQHQRTTLSQVRDAPLRLEPAVTLPGRVQGLHRLDTSGRVLVAQLHREGSSAPVRMDLRDGSWSPLPVPEGAHTHQVLLTGERSGLLVVASDAAGRLQLGLSTVDDPATVHFPHGLNSLTGAVRPLAVDPAGGRIALRTAQGAGAELVLYDLSEDRGRRAALPRGAFHPVAHWGEDGLRVPYSRPERPVDIVCLPPGPDTLAATPDHRPAQAGTERFGEEAGGFEAVCLGDWRRSRGVVVALHGGPEAAWQLRFDPLLHRFAAAGLAVVAPNQRGSTGYGTDHAAAIHGAWGEADLADVRSLVAELAARRGPDAPRPVLYGISYGAYLALLAASADPEAWSACAAVAPFLSPARLHGQAGPQTRALIERHYSGAPATGAPGGDLWQRAGDIRAPLLIVHGDADRTIPVGQSRELRRRLLAAGRREPLDVDYLEIPGAGHEPLGEPGGEVLAARITDFLAVRSGAGGHHFDPRSRSRSARPCGTAGAAVLQPPSGRR